MAVEEGWKVLKRRSMDGTVAPPRGFGGSRVQSQLRHAKHKELILMDDQQVRPPHAPAPFPGATLACPYIATKVAKRYTLAYFLATGQYSQIGRIFLNCYRPLASHNFAIQFPCCSIRPSVGQIDFGRSMPAKCCICHPLYCHG